jgi:anti-sigma B factor antagonist
VADDGTGLNSQGSFRVEVQRDGESALVALVGELDLATVGAVEDQVRSLQGDDPLGRLTLDLRRLEFIDSTGLRLLLTLDAESRQDGFELAIVRGPREVQHVMEATGLDDRLPLVDSPT